MNPAQAIKAARIAAGLSVRELAEKLSVYPNTVYRWERGAMVPRPETLTAIRKATGQPMQIDF